MNYLEKILLHDISHHFHIFIIKEYYLKSNRPDEEVWEMCRMIYENYKNKKEKE